MRKNSPKNRKKTLPFGSLPFIMAPVDTFGSVVESRGQSQAKRST